MEDNESSFIFKINHVINTLFSKFYFLIFVIADVSQAYRIFSLVNDRGIKLDTSDLIKNTLFHAINIDGSKLDNAILLELDNKWTTLRTNITNTDTANYELDRFFYHYLAVFGRYALVNEALESNFSVNKLHKKKCFLFV